MTRSGTEPRLQEPIGALIGRSSLGVRNVRVLASYAPADLVAAILERVVPDPARAFGGGRTYAPERDQTPEEAKGDSVAIRKAGNRKTSARAGRAASKVLRDGRTSKASKTAAGSALSQRAPVRKRAR